MYTGLAGTLRKVATVNSTEPQEVALHARTLAAVAAALCFTAPLAAQTRIPYANSAWTQSYKDKEVTVAFDPKGVEKNDDGTFNIRMRWIYSEDKPIEGGKKYRSMVERKVLNCGNFGTKPISATAYGADGKVVSSFKLTAEEVRDTDWATRKANSSGEKALKATCAAIKKP
jgi:hypothetical protein